MSSHLLLYMVILACSYVLVDSRPSNNESTILEENRTVQDKDSNGDSNKDQRSITYLIDDENNSNTHETLDIVEKIKTINDSLKKPYRKQISPYHPHANEDYVIDNELLEKIKHLIATNKYTKPKARDLQQEDILQETDDNRESYSRDLKFIPNSVDPAPVQVMHIPYTINVPVFVTYLPSNQLSPKYPLNDNRQPNEIYQSRQQQSIFSGFPSFSFPSFQNFQFPSPFSSIFPVLFKDPFTALTQGGGWNNFIEYGQNADVCSRKQKSVADNENIENEILQNIMQKLKNSENLDKMNEAQNDRDSRALRRHIASDSVTQQTDNSVPSKTIIYTKPTATKKTTKKPVKIQSVQPVSNVRGEEEDEDGDLRMPFSEFTLFGNRKPVIPSPGFFINRLRVRKGGVAIAGPGGVATAGNGGTAIVGAGGLAYTKPGGLAVAGPHARVVALSPDSDFSSIISKLQKQNGTYAESSLSIREGRLVATGPAIYYHPKEQT